MLCGIADQLQSPGNRHDFAPFCHVGRRNINNSAVLVTVSDLETKIREYGAALNKRGSGKGNGFFVPDQRAENLQKLWTPAPTTISSGEQAIFRFW